MIFNCENCTERHLMAERDYLMERLEEATRLINEGSDTLVKLMNAEDLLRRWLNIAENGKYGDRSKHPLAIHPIVEETYAALNNSEAGK